MKVTETDASAPLVTFAGSDCDMTLPPRNGLEAYIRENLS